MLTTVMTCLRPDILFIGAAAVADYRVTAPQTEKLKRYQETITLALQRNPDILAAVVASQQAALVVGFAAETNNILNNATEKLYAKQLDMIIANQVGDGLGFDSDENQVTILTANQQIPLTLAPKITLAGQIIVVIAQTLQNFVRSGHDPIYSN
jgi:phosphopantothenoylcysteine decarboxylase/phosphopantothenate--cysteine ligase